MCESHRSGGAGPVFRAVRSGRFSAVVEHFLHELSMAAGVVVRGRHAAFFLQVVYFLFIAAACFSSTLASIRANEYLSYHLLTTP